MSLKSITKEKYRDRHTILSHDNLIIYNSTFRCYIGIQKQHKSNQTHKRICVEEVILEVLAEKKE